MKLSELWSWAGLSDFKAGRREGGHSWVSWREGVGGGIDEPAPGGWDAEDMVFMVVG